MTVQLDPTDDRVRLPAAGHGPRVEAAEVVRRRLLALVLVAVPLAWAVHRALRPIGGPGTGSDLVNPGGWAQLGRLGASVLHPALSGTFLSATVDATVITVVFASLGTTGALAIGALGGLVLSDATWEGSPPWPVRLMRLVMRGVLVAVRSVHEVVWALLFVSVLGLDPLVAVLAIAVPFGAQTAKIFAETLDGVPPGPLRALRAAGVRWAPAVALGLLPQATPMLVSYMFYRFECAIRSAVVLGVVGVGGLGQELSISLASRNWDEVWTLIGAVLLLSAGVDLWSGRLRADLAVTSCAEWSSGVAGCGSRRAVSRWARGSAFLALPGIALAWWVSEVSLAGLASPRTRQLSHRLAADLWPPQAPVGGWGRLASALADTVAMAVLAMAVAVAVTVIVGPWAARPRRSAADEHPARWRTLIRVTLWGSARLSLVALRSIPPTVWAVIALLALFPGILPGALALGAYTGGVLGRLVAEAWESVDLRPRTALLAGGVPRRLASLAGTVPPSAHHLITFTLYRLEICVRDTTVVGVVGAAGLGRLLSENLSAFRFSVVTTLLLASFAVTLATEIIGRRLRRAMRP